MNVINLLNGLCLTLFIHTCASEPAHLPLNSVFSEARRNVFITFWNGFYTEKGSNKPVEFRAEKVIKYGFASLEAKPYDVFVLDKAFGCNITARSESGQIVAKTREGSKYGSKFSEVTTFDKGQLDFANQHGLRGHEFPYISIADPDGGIFSRDLPPLQSLFKLDSPGKYFVAIQLQVFVGPYDESNPTNVHLIRFPPVNLLVIKEGAN